jgi:hypothetical protein
VSLSTRLSGPSAEVARSPAEGPGPGCWEGLAGRLDELCQPPRARPCRPPRRPPPVPFAKASETPFRALDERSPRPSAEVSRGPPEGPPRGCLKGLAGRLGELRQRPRDACEAARIEASEGAGSGSPKELFRPSARDRRERRREAHRSSLMGVGEGRGVYVRGLSAGAVETPTWPRSEGRRGHRQGARRRVERPRLGCVRRGRSGALRAASSGPS